MPLPKELTTVTRLSKFVALVLYIALPFIGFLIGLQYQQSTDQLNKEIEISKLMSTITKKPDQILVLTLQGTMNDSSYNVNLVELAKKVSIL